MTPRGRCVTPSLLSAMCVGGVGLSSVHVPLSHHPSSLAPPPPAQLGYALCRVGQWYALPPLLPGQCIPHASVCTGTWLVGWLVVGFRVAWLVVGLVGWLLVDWFLVSRVWLAGWLVGCVVGWLLASCWGVRLCCMDTCLRCCCTSCLCVSMPVQPLQGSLGGLCTFDFGVLARCSSDVLGSEAAPLEQRQNGATTPR